MKRILSMVVIAILSMSLLRIEHATAQFDNGEHYVTINGVRHWYRIAGASNGGTPIVVVHGGPGGSVYTFEHSAAPGRRERLSGSTVRPATRRPIGRTELIVTVDAQAVPVSRVDSSNQKIRIYRVDGPDGLRPDT